MNSTAIDIEGGGQDLGNNIRGYAHRILNYYSDPEFCTDDYADLFLMYLGENDEENSFRLPQGRIRGLQNLYDTWRSPERRIEVIITCLTDIFTAMKRKNPNYTELEFGDFIDNFMTDEEGYHGPQRARKAKGAPYFGHVARLRKE